MTLVLCLIQRTSAPFTPALVQSPKQRAQNKLHELHSFLGLATITDSYSPNTDFGSWCSHGLKSAGRGPAAGAARSLFRLLSTSAVSPQHPTQRGLWQTARSQASKESQEHQQWNTDQKNIQCTCCGEKQGRRNLHTPATEPHPVWTSCQSPSDFWLWLPFSQALCHSLCPQPLPASPLMQSQPTCSVILYLLRELVLEWLSVAIVEKP